MNGKKNLGSALGKNPLGDSLSRGIFSKTEGNSTTPHIHSILNPRADESVVESSNQIQDSSFLEQGEKEKVNLRIPIELNDWLDDLVKKGKRNHGQKIPKEMWLQAALELFRALPTDWYEVSTVEDLRHELENQETRFKIKG